MGQKEEEARAQSADGRVFKIVPWHHLEHSTSNSLSIQALSHDLTGSDRARVMLKGSSTFVSMYSQKGSKGVNQDALTVWPDFTGKKDMIFCGVFDGHDPLGHRLSQCIRDNLPSKLSAPIKLSQEKAMKHCHANATNGGSHSDVHVEDNQNMSFPSWEGTFMRSSLFFVCFFVCLMQNIRGEVVVSSVWKVTMMFSEIKHSNLHNRSSSTLAALSRVLSSLTSATIFSDHHLLRYPPTIFVVVLLQSWLLIVLSSLHCRPPSFSFCLPCHRQHQHV
ncbi:putative disease resistance RPP13-like protein 1 isoform E [Glycine soja]|uniref:Putative disease resistance RPP13-like protein 1 isoform D n=1 Tax=Glycine soja TaxID=3848 RepID=A0A445L7R4_GLYSO|nr:putative disease resistance RPP13-like protein 1 isoform D [Glycine soja]RZC19119.1 putative disease resistance RPP13-like protein 1 isoform E [Glycine soja]